MEVTEQLLDAMGHYNVVWEHTEPIKDQVGYRAALRAGEVLIAHVDNNVVEVVL